MSPASAKRFISGRFALCLIALWGILSYPLSAQEPTKEAEREPKLSEGVRRRVARAQLDKAIQELVQVRSDLRKERVKLAFLQSELKQEAASNSDKAALEAIINEDPQVREFEKEIANYKKQLASYELVTAGGRSSSIYKQTEKELAGLEKGSLARRRKLLPLAQEKRKQDTETFRQVQLKPLQDHVASLQDLEKALVADIGRFDAEAKPAQTSTEERLRLLEKEVRALKKTSK